MFTSEEEQWGGLKMEGERREQGRGHYEEQ